MSKKPVTRLKGISLLLLCRGLLLLHGCAPTPEWDVGEKIALPDLPPHPDASGDQPPVTWFFLPETLPEGNAHRFHTRDPLLAAEEGKTLWKILETSPPPGESRDYTLIRYSGEDRGGYGLILQFREGTPDPEFYLLLIDAAGHAFAGRYRQETLTVLSPWHTETGLRTGRGIPNRLTVTENGPGSFTVRFNVGPELEISDPLPPSGTGSERGYCAVITPRDVLPLYPVDVRWIQEEE